MSTRTITVYKCDACSIEKQAPEYDYGGTSGYTSVKFDGVTNHVGAKRVTLGTYHACSAACLAVILSRLATTLQGIDVADAPKVTA